MTFLLRSRKRLADDPYSAKLPYLAGTVIGVREWTYDEGLKPITSHLGGFEWRADGSPTEAECRSGHEPPQPECGCGLYAYHPWSVFGLDLLSRRSSESSVVGLVAAWGKIEVHKDGFRAQQAKPVAFVFRAREFGVRWRGDLNRERLDELTRLADRCGAEVIHADDPTAVPRWLEGNGGQLAEGSVEKLLAPRYGATRRRLAKVNWPDFEAVIAFPFQLVFGLFFGLLVFAVIAVQFLWWGFVIYAFVAAVTGFDPVGLGDTTEPERAGERVQTERSPANERWHPPMNR